MSRLVVFASPRDVAARVLLPALLEAVARQTELSCVGILVPDAEPAAMSAWGHWWERGRRRVQMVLGSGRPEAASRVPALDLARLARRHGTPVWRMPGGDPNGAAVLDQLDRQLRPHLAVSIYCLARFRQALLDRFGMVVNYHNGRLPEYRGLRASNWSLYMAEPTSGYAFHRMDAGLDTGNVLIAGDVAADHLTPADLELRKARAAARRLPELLTAMSRGEAGRPQARVGCCHDRTAYALATQVDDPSALSRAEWGRRLRGFLRIQTCIDGRWWPVTGLVPAPGPGRLVFRTADGHWLRVSGLGHWPAWLWRGRQRGAAA